MKARRVSARAPGASRRNVDVRAWRQAATVELRRRPLVPCDGPTAGELAVDLALRHGLAPATCVQCRGQLCARHLRSHECGRAGVTLQSVLLEYLGAESHRRHARA